KHRLPVSTAASLNASDGVLLAADGYTATATYMDMDCNADGTAGCQRTLADCLCRFGCPGAVAAGTSSGLCPPGGGRPTGSSCAGAASVNDVECKPRVATSVFDCSPNVNFTAIGQPGRNFPFLLAGGCDDDRYFDNQETFVYLVQFQNLEGGIDL